MLILNAAYEHAPLPRYENSEVQLAIIGRMMCVERNATIKVELMRAEAQSYIQMREFSNIRQISSWLKDQSLVKRARHLLHNVGDMI
jgi:hypothetical protein